ncbi:MAG: cytochrome c biogenesis protein ResB [Bdellovibrionales bacterium]
MNTPANGNNNKIKQILMRLADADMVFWLMPPLIVLLIAGTLAQAWMGLWPALHMFFAAFVIWAGPVPLPGGYTLLGILSLNLTLKFLFKSEWSRRKSGIILTHLGALILLIGGLITAITAREHYMVIPEGHETPFIYDYQQRELQIYKNDMLYYTMPFEALKPATTLKDILPFTATITDRFDNIQIIKREDAPDYNPDTDYRGMARFMAFRHKAPGKDPQSDLTGFTLKIENTNEEQNGFYVVFEAMPKPVTITKGKDTYRLVFGKKQTQLPFSIALIDFQKQSYQGMDMARSYSSDIIVKDHGAQWPVRIEMNKPLRYKGYTFFQSSFEQTPQTEATILAVVKNSGWVIPYLGTSILGIGLLLHIVIVMGGIQNKAKSS